MHVVVYGMVNLPSSMMESLELQLYALKSV